MKQDAASFGRGIFLSIIFIFTRQKERGQKIKFGGKELYGNRALQANIIDKKIDIAIFSAGGAVSEFAPIFAQTILLSLIIQAAGEWTKMCLWSYRGKRRSYQNHKTLLPILIAPLSKALSAKAFARFV